MIESFAPVFDGDSRVLILGSMASVKSLEAGFFYMHPRNRFWSTLAEITGDPVPESIEGKREYLLAHRIALMDSIKTCTRKGSLDADIRDVVPSDIPAVIAASKIAAVFCNGAKSYEVAKRAYPDIDFIRLPSTSPANAGAWDKSKWMAIKKPRRSLRPKGIDLRGRWFAPAQNTLASTASTDKKPTENIRRFFVGLLTCPLRGLFLGLVLCRYKYKRAVIARFRNVAEGNISLQKTDPLSRVRLFVIVDYFLSLSARF